MIENNPYQTDPFNKTEKVTVNEPAPDFRYRPSQTHIWLGLFLLIVGSVWLLRRMGLEIPEFITSWQMVLIGIGVFIGIRKDFQGATWLILILIGTLLLINEFFLYGELRKFILPIILIGSGLFVIFRPKRNYGHHLEIGSQTIDGMPASAPAALEDTIDTTSVFGGTKKKVFSKNFRGGEMVNIFGGSLIDLTQADINGTAIVDVTTLFGGATLLVPSHWNVVSDAVSIFGEVKDKRVMQNLPENNNKTLLIKGTVIFGGIDVKSF